MSNKVLKALWSIQRDIHASGIGKTRRNKEQNFDFRGIDDALRAFAPLFTTHSVLCAPNFHDLVVSARQTKSGGTTYNVQVQGTFTFTSVEDGSAYVVGPVYGEANDGQDKAISKAESVAFRQMLFIAFAVPHEPVIGGDPDESSTDESLDAKASDWIRSADQIQEPDEYQPMLAKLKADYGGKMSDIPDVVKSAFVTAKARVMPQDETDA